METYKKSYFKFILCIVLSFLTYIMSNGVWSIPVFAWVYPILFLSMLHFDRSIKTCFIIISIYAIGFNLQFADMIGIDIWICVLISISIALLKTLPYFYWMKSKMIFKSTITFAASMLIVEYLIYLIYPILGGLCQKGDGMLKSFDTKYGKIAPFICSDMAFCSKIQQAGKKNVDILIVPASDWKEMTQTALKTAVVRGVENGCNIIRHTNRGKSIVSDYKGNILALSDYFQSDTKTLASQVLTKGRFTLYSQIGDIFVCLCGIYLLVILFFQMIVIKNSMLSNYK